MVVRVGDEFFAKYVAVCSRFWHTRSKYKTQYMIRLILFFLCALCAVNAKTLNRNPSFADGTKGWFGKREVVELMIDGEKESVLRVTPEIIGDRSFSPNSFKESNYSELKVSFTYRAASLVMGDLRVVVAAKSPDLTRDYRISLKSSQEWITVDEKFSGFEWHDRISLRFFCEHFEQGEIQFKEIFIEN